MCAEGCCYFLDKVSCSPDSFEFAMYQQPFSLPPNTPPGSYRQRASRPPGAAQLGHLLRQSCSRWQTCPPFKLPGDGFLKRPQVGGASSLIPAGEAGQGPWQLRLPLIRVTFQLPKASSTAPAFYRQPRIIQEPFVSRLLTGKVRSARHQAPGYRGNIPRPLGDRGPEGTGPPGSSRGLGG